MATTTKRALANTGPISFSDLNWAIRSSANTDNLSLSKDRLRGGIAERRNLSVSLSDCRGKFLPYGGVVGGGDHGGYYSSSDFNEQYTTSTFSWGDDTDDRVLVIVAAFDDNSQPNKDRLINMTVDGTQVTLITQADASGSTGSVSGLGIGVIKTSSTSGTVTLTYEPSETGGGSQNYNSRACIVFNLRGLPLSSSTNYRSIVEDWSLYDDRTDVDSASITLDSDDRDDSIFLFASSQYSDSGSDLVINFNGEVTNSSTIDVWGDGGGTSLSGHIFWDMDGYAGMAANTQSADATDTNFVGVVFNKSPVSNAVFSPGYAPPPPPPPPPSPPPPSGSDDGAGSGDGTG